MGKYNNVRKLQVNKEEKKNTAGKITQHNKPPKTGGAPVKLQIINYRKLEFVYAHCE